MILDLTPPNDPLLRQQLEPFDPSSVDLETIVADMFETMHHHKGVGLSANQVGLPHRLFVMGTDEMELVFINPEIRFISEETEIAEEGCLTHPGLFIKVKRPNEVRLTSTNMLGETKALTYKGMTARIILHEMDHLEGMEYQRRANRIHLERGRNQLKKWKKRNGIL
jgi:peptide deformylase